MSEASHADPLKSYLLVFFALLSLLGLTVAVYYIPFERIGHGQYAFMNTALALTIATTKALLVMLVFMHLRHSTRLTWVVAVAGFMWLGILLTFTFADYKSRSSIPEATNVPIREIRAVPMEH